MLRDRAISFTVVKFINDENSQVECKTLAEEEEEACHSSGTHWFNIIELGLLWAQTFSFSL